MQEQQIDRMKSAFAVVREAIAEGRRVDFARGVTFEPTQVMVVLAEEGGMALAVTKDRRLWIGQAGGLGVGMVPSIYSALIGDDMRHARQRWEIVRNLTREVEHGEAKKS